MYKYFSQNPIVSVGILFTLEVLLLTLRLDGQALIAGSGMSHFLGLYGAFTLRFLVTLVAMAGTFVFLNRRTALAQFGMEAAGRGRGWLRCGLHGALYIAMLAAGSSLYAAEAKKQEGMALLFLALGMGVLVSGAAVAAPIAAWFRLARGIGAVWIYSALMAGASIWMTALWRSLWEPASALTYSMVRAMLTPFVSGIVAQPTEKILGTGRFSVEIAEQCSGLEGVGLILLFGAGWLLLYRKECRFPHALALLPVAVVAMFVLNSVRIAALILIGNAGAAQIAEQGFHSQAGWIAFNSVAFGLCIVAGRVGWIAKGDRLSVREETVNPVLVYLAGFLAILAAGMLVRAMTGAFEWLYPTRVLAAGAALWAYRGELRRIDWRVTWAGPAAGVAVFAIWMVGQWGAASPMPAELAEGSDFARWGWIAVRVLGAAVTVPIAEELAFRGYLLRRFVAADFEAVSPGTVTILAVAISSVLFGAMHGSRWFVGALAGAVYAWVYMRRGKLGDAVAAHAVTNALIAACVLGLGYWRLW